MVRKRLLTVARDDPGQVLPLLRLRLRIGEQEARGLILGGAVYVGRGRCQDPAAPLSPGTRIVVHQQEGPEALATELPRIVHRDPDVLVVDKPAGLLTQPSPGTDRSLLSWLAGQGEEARLIHRLDRDASGLLLLARRKEACAPLQQALLGGAIRRHYLAVVAGQPDPAGGRIELRIARDRGDSRRRVALPQAASGGEAALTCYTVEQVLPGDRTLLRLELHTGRTHQIRVHLSAIGHAIVGDTCYGGRPAPRLLLHAAQLIFPHPRTGAPCSFMSPFPAAFAE